MDNMRLNKAPVAQLDRVIDRSGVRISPGAPLR